MPALTKAQLDPRVQGFGFQNYTNAESPMNLTPAEIHRMFGDAVCATGTGATCTLTPPATQWMNNTSASMNGGHCEGMAVLSQRFFLGLSRPQDFGAATGFALTLSGNAALQREIGYWFALQSLAPIWPSAHTMRSPNELEAAIEQAPAALRSTIAFWRLDMTGGHAVTPIGVRRTGDTAAIIVYDNNFPGETRTIDINVAQNSWRYVAAASPDVPASTYEGTAASNTLRFVDLGARDAAKVCPFCTAFVPGMQAPARASTVGSASVLIANGAGQQIGHDDNDDLVDEIDGADLQPVVSDDLWADRGEPSYQLPGGAYTATLTARSSEVSESGMSIVANGFLVEVDDIMLDPDQEDHLSWDSSRAMIHYETAGRETPHLTLAVNATQSDWNIELRVHGSAGIVVEAELMTGDAEALRLDIDRDPNATVDLEITRVDANGSVPFNHVGVAIPMGSRARLPLSSLRHDGDSLMLQIDENRDGTFERTMMLVDQQTGTSAPDAAITDAAPTALTDAGASDASTPPPSGSSGCSTRAHRRNNACGALVLGAYALLIVFSRRGRSAHS